MCLVVFVRYAAIAGAAYFIQQWRYLIMALTVPCLVTLSYNWTLPESPRWLIMRGYTKRARSTLERGARANGVALPSKLYLDEMHRAQCGDAASSTPRDDAIEPLLTPWRIVIDTLKMTWSSFRMLLFNAATPNVRRRTLNLYFNWLVTAMVYYGLAFSSTTLAGSVYLNFICSGAVELPATALGYISYQWMGRRWPLLISLVVGGICCVAVATLDVVQMQADSLKADDIASLAVIFALVGKFCITASFNMIYVFTSELMPTELRSIGLGSCSTMARVGSTLAPFILLLRDTFWRPLPMLIFGSLAVLAGFFVIFLPETHHAQLPETVDDAEHFGQLKARGRRLSHVRPESAGPAPLPLPPLDGLVSRSHHLAAAGRTDHTFSLSDNKSDKRSGRANNTSFISAASTLHTISEKDSERNSLSSANDEVDHQSAQSRIERLALPPNRLRESTRKVLVFPTSGGASSTKGSASTGRRSTISSVANAAVKVHSRMRGLRDAVSKRESQLGLIENSNVEESHRGYQPSIGKRRPTGRTVNPTIHLGWSVYIDDEEI